MFDVNSTGKTLIVFGAIAIIAGVILLVGGKFAWFGRLPGDIYIEKKGFALFFPITTSILISIVLSLLLLLTNRK